MAYITQILAMLPFAIMLGWLFKRLFKHWLWSLVGGAFGVFIFGLVVTNLALFNWLNLGEDTFGAAIRYFLIFGWSVGTVGGAIGGVLEWISRTRQKPARGPQINPPKPSDENKP
jgi:hypothetical protein